MPAGLDEALPLYRTLPPEYLTRYDGAGLGCVPAVEAGWWKPGPCSSP